MRTLLLPLGARIRATCGYVPAAHWCVRCRKCTFTAGQRFVIDAGAAARAVRSPHAWPLLHALLAHAR
jgi:hypothetical protein